MGAVRFGDFILDPSDESLSRIEASSPSPSRLVLRGKSFAVLCALVANHGRLVTRTRLLELVWPDAAIHEQGLSVCIKEIRAVLEDDPRRPRFVETVHRRGYRFLADVRAATASLPAPVISHAQTVTHDESAYRSNGARAGSRPTLVRGIYCIWTNGVSVLLHVPLVDGARELGRGPIGGWSLDDTAVSRRHARVSCTVNRWRVEDCGSRNGSFVDGRPVTKTSIDAKSGSIVRIGETLLILSDDLRREERAASIVRALERGARGRGELRASFIERALLDRRDLSDDAWTGLARRACERVGAGAPITAAAYSEIAGAA